MKKRMIALLMVLTLILSLFAGCTSDDNGNAVAEKDEPMKDEVEIIVTPTYVGTKDAETIITWQPAPFHSMFSSNPARVEYLEGVLREWAEAHPGVGVEIIETTTNINESMAKTLIQLAAGGDVPDVTSIDSFIFPRFAKYAQPIGDVLEANNIMTEDFFPYVQNVVKPADDVLGLWYTTDVRVLFYRKDLLPEPPKTTAEMIQMGQELTEDGYTALLYTGTTETALTDVVFPIFWGQGGKLVDEAGKPVFGEGENKEYLKKTIEFVKETIDSGIAPERVLSVAQNGFASEVATGNVAMFMAGNWQAKNQRDVIGELFDENWAVAQIPMINEGDRMSTAGGWVSTVFTKDEEKRKLAADLIVSIYGTDSGMEGWCSVGGYLPPRESVFESDSFKQDKFSAAFKEELNYAGVRPAALIYAEVSTAIQEIVEKTIIGEGDIETMIDEAFERVLEEHANLD
jgi:multiple sugar transport system substrate-binding protein